jgi:hypothetical protein
LVAAPRRSSLLFEQQARAPQGAALLLVSDSAPVAPLSHDRLPHGRLSDEQRLSDARLGEQAARLWWRGPLLAALQLADLLLTARSARVMSLGAKGANAAFARAPNVSSLVDQASHRLRMPESSYLHVATSALRATKELAWALPKEPMSSQTEVTLSPAPVGLQWMAVMLPRVRPPQLQPPQRASVVLDVQVLTVLLSRPPRAQVQRRCEPTLLRQIVGSSEVRSRACSERR